MGKLSNEAKSLMAQYKDSISESYFRKLHNKLDGNLDELKNAIENKINKKTKEKPKRQPRQYLTNLKSNTTSSYDIPLPDHIMSKDEYWVYLSKHIRKSIYMIRNKYWTLKANGISNEDLETEILIKCVRKTKDGRDRYQEYLQNPECLVTIRAYINFIVANHFKDYLKSLKWTSTKVSLDKPLPGQDNLTLGDTQGKWDEDNTSITELMERCQNVVIKVKHRRRNSNQELIEPEEERINLNDILNKVIEGYSFVAVCREYKVSPKIVRNKLIEVGAKELLGSN